MTTHSSASVRAEAPHSKRLSRTNTIMNALKRRAQAVLNDESLDPQTRAIIRYGLETNDPWLAELVRRADDGEDVFENMQSFDSNENDSSGEKVEALAEIICRDADEPATKSAALVVLMSVLEHAMHPKALANTAKHVAFVHCAEINFCDIVNAQISVIERELLRE
jgi:hypothetical protein